MDGKWKKAGMVICIVIAAAVVILTAFHKDSKSSLNIIFIKKSSISSNDFWAEIEKGAEMAARENNVILEVMSPEDETKIKEQNDLIMKAISEKPDAIAITPASATENSEALKKVKEAGIPLVFVDSVTDEKIADAVVATDNMAAGKKMSSIVLKTIDDDDSIGIVSHIKEASTAQEREEGFREGLGSHASQIVDVVYSNSIVSTGEKATKQMLTEHPEISYIACLNEDSAVGAGRAVKEMGLTGQMTMVGFDNATEEISNLESGLFSAIVVQKAFTMGYFGIENAAKLARGTVVDYYTDAGSALITKNNMYTVANQELLFPFTE